MKIRIDLHTLGRALERGTHKEEIIDVLLTGVDARAKGHRKSRAKVFDYGQKRLGTFYEQKKVEVIYTIENDTIITVTVYVFYGSWEGRK
ncbi:MAG: hypothetical protein C4526_04600 [Nitrospiraceae bacterium]|nr:MAG: hypothetical protein C4526_04600 [Nitrospiraceae bacterium]